MEYIVGMALVGCSIGFVAGWFLPLLLVFILNAAILIWLGYLCRDMGRQYYGSAAIGIGLFIFIPCIMWLLTMDGVTVYRYGHGLWPAIANLFR